MLYRINITLVGKLCAIFFTGCLILSCHCESETNNVLYIIDSPESITQKALDYAKKYLKSDTEYEYGGQDLLRALKIDCSGLVVNCYQYAVEGTRYSLLFQDAAVIDFYKKWTIETDNPRPGDIIFMGDDKFNPNHMSFFVKYEGDFIHFIDATFKPEEGVNGVSERSYHKNDKRFLSFGILLLQLEVK